MPIVCQLYQILNHFLHCGPTLDRKRPLERPIHLRELVVRVQMQEDSQSYRRRMYAEMNRILRMLQNETGPGIVNAYVDRIRVTNGEVESTRTSGSTEQARPSDEWTRYGFKWGVRPEAVA